LSLEKDRRKKRNKKVEIAHGGIASEQTNRFNDLLTVEEEMLISGK